MMRLFNHYHGNHQCIIELSNGHIGHSSIINYLFVYLPAISLWHVPSCEIHPLAPRQSAKSLLTPAARSSLTSIETATQAGHSGAWTHETWAQDDTGRISCLQIFQIFKYVIWCNILLCVYCIVWLCFKLYSNMYNFSVMWPWLSFFLSFFFFPGEWPVWSNPARIHREVKRKSRRRSSTKSSAKRGSRGRARCWTGGGIH